MRVPVRRKTVPLDGIGHFAGIAKRAKFRTTTMTASRRVQAVCCEVRGENQLGVRWGWEMTTSYRA